MNANEIKVGMLVKVGPRYQMAAHPPFIGRGTFVSDAYTGKVLRVVAVRQNNLGPTSAALADASLIGVDESDEIVDIVLRRLERFAGGSEVVVF